MPQTREAANLARRTKPHSFFKALYRNQRHVSIRRGHPAPAYTYDELVEWLSLQPNLTQLWSDYQDSDHERFYAPSLDRLDDSLPYSLSNIRLTTWKENFDKSRTDIHLGKLNKGLTKNIPVLQLALDGSILAEYQSYSHAEKVTGLHASNIRACCLGIQTHTGHTYWRHK